MEIDSGYRLRVGPAQVAAIWGVATALLIPVPAFAQCPANPAGGPSVVTMSEATEGVLDFDLGTAGTLHNVELLGLQFDVCLSGCDTDSVAQCSIVEIQPDAASLGLAPPIPISQPTGGICAQLVFPTPVPAAIGTANVQTGAIALQTTLNAQFFAGSGATICPECIGGKCVRGASVGTPCIVDASVRAGAKTYQLSHTCQPGGTAAGSVSIPIALTTGTASQGACAGQSSADSCAGLSRGTCGQTGCTNGQDGVTQECCSLATARSCLPPGGLSRSGNALAPLPAWGAGSAYPKMANETFATTTCALATGSATIDGALGLPGIAAGQIELTSTWFASSPGTTTTTQPGATTTTTPPGATTTTTLAGDCSPSGCDDDNGCTDDTCSGGACSHTLQSGITGVRCLVTRVKSRPLCGTEVVDAKLASNVGRVLGKVDGHLAKVDAATGKKRVKFVKKTSNALGTITKLATKATAKHKISLGCRTTIATEVTHILAALTAAQ